MSTKLQQILSGIVHPVRPAGYRNVNQADGHRDGLRRISAPFWLFNLLGFSVYFGLFVYSVYHGTFSTGERGLVYSPARSSVSYEKKTIDESVLADFALPPSLEADTAWHKLLKYNNLLVQEEDLKQVDRTSVPMLDGSGYLASLSVIHQLHCVNYIREYAFPDYYVQETGQPRKDHIFHCIDNLRKIIMCHGDITPRTFEWSDTDPKPVMKPVSVHECRRWEPIYEFAASHSPRMGSGPILENPEFGLIYPHGVNHTQA